MRGILLAGAVLALSACSGGNQNNADNNVGADNMSMGDTTLDANMMAGSNMGAGNMGAGTMGAGAMGANGSVNAATGNGAADAHTRALMKKDMKTHDHDTNLANGI